MGLFGDVDASSVPNDPFYVAPDTYNAILTEVVRVTDEEKNRDALVFQWSVDDEDSPYYHNVVKDWKNIYPDVAESELTADMRKDQARLKGRLLEMGVPESEMDSLLDNLDELKGLEAVIVVTETTSSKDPSKKFTNIQKVRTDDDEE